LAASCPYKLIFEPSPPPGADQLSKNQDTPRPFIFRPPLDSRTTYNPGEAFDFHLTLLGKAVDYLPYFVLAFRELAREGIGLNRAPCELERVEALAPETAALEAAGGVGANKCDVILSPSSASTNHVILSSPCSSAGEGSPQFPSPDAVETLRRPQVIYSRDEDLFRPPAPFTLADWIRPRLLRWTNVPRRFTISFLTPTYLKFKEQAVRKPDFHHLFKRVRDRLNAVCTFFGPGPIDADFKALGHRAEQVRTVKADVRWLERSRHSSKTGQRHELSGFVGQCTYEFPSDEPEVSNLELLKWVLCGEIVHVGRHTAWGNGGFRLS
jgi:hypothetical protein